MAIQRRTPVESARRCGYSLIEVVAAIGLMVAALVPALELVRTSLEKSVEDDMRQLLSLYAVAQVEAQLSPAADTWATGTYTGDYSSEGHADIRFTTVCSDAVAEGGILGKLMAIKSTVYQDANGDDSLSSGELKCQYQTKIGKFATYAAKTP